ncbi:hypothetical protein ACLKA6_009820 [Drosophila palustris]
MSTGPHPNSILFYMVREEFSCRSLKNLKEHLKLSAEKMGITNTLKWYQDYDPKNNAHKVKFWLLLTKQFIQSYS